MADEHFEWAFDMTFNVSENLTIRVLQRQVTEPSVFLIDLLPFRESPALWQTGTSGVHEGSPGVLAAADVSDVRDIYSIRDNSGIAKDTVIDLVKHRQLTAWRVAEQLDMLQIRVDGTSGSLYAQLGGGKTLPILAAIEALDPGDATLRRIRHLYVSGELVSE